MLHIPEQRYSIEIANDFDLFSNGKPKKLESIKMASTFELAVDWIDYFMGEEKRQGKFQSQYWIRDVVEDKVFNNKGVCLNPNYNS